MADFGNVAEQAKQFWSTRSGRQKALLLAGAGITVGPLDDLCPPDGNANLQAALSGYGPGGRAIACCAA